MGTSMTDRSPKDAISFRKEQPPPHERVLAWVSDRSVAIHHFPVVVWRDSNNEWWGGVPGNYLDLRLLKWKITHWRRI
jgi:hypothetical protein